MKSKRLFLHIGRFKTGTSSIQRTLFKNREQLLASDFYYPEHVNNNHVLSFPFLFIDNPQASPEFKKKLAKYKDADELIFEKRNMWMNEFNCCKCSNFIICAENLSMFNINEIKKVRLFLENFFDEVKIVVYLRHFSTLIPSEIQQAVKNNYFPVDFNSVVDDYINHRNDIIFYKKTIENWSKVFSRENLVVRPYEKDIMKNKDVVLDFLQTIGCNPDKLELEKITANKTMGSNAVAFLSRLNESYPVFINGKPNPERGMSSRYIQEDVYDIKNDKPFIPTISYTQEQAAVLNEQIEFANKYFNNGYRFEKIQVEQGQSEFVNFKELSTDFYIELVNNHNLWLDRCERKRDNLLKKKKAIIQNKEKIYLKKLLDIYYIKSKTMIICIRNLLKWLLYSIIGLEGFDKEYYINTYKEHTQWIRFPLLHFMIRGVYRGYNPNPEFNIPKYIKKHPEIVIHGENALLHLNRYDKR